ncbi:hypothetical protein HanXRQr2_Chr08g0336921 [Helianthus annuus]|uniref:Secreted protein n=1 Tax=Helianthus annuus TaxID=4232 RepID=A0A251SWQ4_HELAN|nr:hypothetical protein HanXRQr2_Chr08g0336921 [Helianthus annuus]
MLLLLLFVWLAILLASFFSCVVRSVRTVRATILGDLSSTLLMELDFASNGFIFPLNFCKLHIHSVKKEALQLERSVNWNSTTQIHRRKGLAKAAS